MTKRKITTVAYVTEEMKKEIQNRVEELGINESAYLNLILRKELKEKFL